MLTFDPIVLFKTGRQPSCLQDQPKQDGMSQFCETLKGEGILCEETHDDTIRLALALVTTSN